MRRRTRYLTLTVTLGLALAASPALAAPSSAKLEVNENCVQPEWPCWAAPGSSQPAFKTTIVTGGTVMFVDHGREANVAWTGAHPACESSVPVAPATPKTGWEGKCSFETPGTYAFESSTLFKDAYEDYTKYEVVVEGSATTPPSTGPTGTPTTPTTPVSSPTPEAPFAGAQARAVKLAHSQRGATVKGSIDLSQAAAGDHLEIDLLAQGASLGKGKHGGRLRVGRYTRSSLLAGKLSFAVELNVRARQAIKRHHRLALTVEIVLTRAGGATVTVTRSVIQHG